jgi:hypothetical protein
MSASKQQFLRLLLAGAILGAGSLHAQQSTTIPAGTPTATPAPCTPPPPQKCGFVCREEQRLRIQAAIKSCQLTKGNVCDSPDIPTNNPRPCPVPLAPPPAPAAPTTAPDSKPIVSDDLKHLYVCPRNSSKVEDLPVCQMPDHSFVPLMEIPVPAGSLKGGVVNGAGAGNANPAANNTTSTTPLTDAKPNPNAVTNTPTH